MNFRFRTFDIDHNLIFVIQSMTKESTEEILTTLHEAATTVVTETLKKSRARGLSKRVKFFYKKGTIPILMCCNGMWYDSYKTQMPDKPYPVDIEVRFPKKILRVKPEDLENLASQKFEKNIGLREEMTQLADLDKPVVELPRGLKGVL